MHCRDVWYIGLWPLQIHMPLHLLEASMLKRDALVEALELHVKVVMVEILVALIEIAISLFIHLK